jgi:ketosteroid isomerase-like protein
MGRLFRGTGTGAQALVRREVEAINSRRDAAVLDEFLTPDYLWHLPGRDVRGRDAVKAEFAQTLADLADLRLVAETVLTDGNRVVVRWTIRGTSRATEKYSERVSVSIDRMANGKFAEGCEVFGEQPWIDATAEKR